jgi:flagellar hook-length control protein FliK
MPQLPITPAVSPQSGAGIRQAPAAAEGGDGLECAPGLDFGAALTKHLNGVALLLEQKEDAAPSLAAARESADPAANPGAAVLSVDLSVLTASMLVPAHPVQAGRGDGTLAETLTEAGTEKPLMQLPKDGGVQMAAEIAVNGKNLPQAVSPEPRFADKLAALVEVPAGNTGGEPHSTDLPLVANSSVTAAVFRNPEPLTALRVAPTVGSAEWGGAVGEKVVWMVNQSHQVAELHLNPPNLGPLEVRLTISNDQASALFVSHHSAVREAIETALPRLREMLADNGIMLGNVTVGSESFSQQQASDQRNGKEGGRGGLGAESVMARMAVPGRPSGMARDGMVDIFA